MVELPSALPLHQDGKAPIIAIATPQRSAVLPNVQTFIEASLLELPRLRGRSAGSDQSFMSIFLASYSMGER